ncbi:Hsp33 family molecular chaperone HslO [Betaproteobacteria bacterium]|nr:Hsp33 family molecular chaperone HslO [Betaproteobacteria bacterium]
MSKTHQNRSSTFLIVDQSVKLTYVELVLDSTTFRQTRDHITLSSLRLLSELTVANILLSSSLKYKGSVILQIHGQGIISLAVSECNNAGEFRSIIKENQNNPKNKNQLYSFKELVAPDCGGLFVASIKPHKKSMRIYQGIVQINDRGVGYSLEHYLNKSEQVKSWLKLFIKGDIAKGILLQALPEDPSQKKMCDWELLTSGLEQIETSEIIHNDLDDLLLKKYIDEKLIRTKNFYPIFQCTCQREKIIASIKQFNKPELLNERQKRTKMKVICEFCGTVFLIAPEELDKTLKTRGATE